MIMATAGIMGKIFRGKEVVYHPSMPVLEIAFAILLGMVLTSIYTRVKTDPAAPLDKKASVGRDTTTTFLKVGFTLAVVHLLTELAKRIP